VRAPDGVPSGGAAIDEELHAEIARLRRELEEKSLEADALHRVSEAIASADDMNQMLGVVAEVAVSVTGTEACFIYLLDEARGELVMRAQHGTDPSVVGRLRLRQDEGLTGWVAREKKPLAISEAAWKDRRFRYFPELREERYQSFLSAPIAAKGKTIGVINVRTTHPHKYSARQIHLLGTIASQVAGAIELARLYHASETKASQLTAISEVSKSITSNLYLDEVLQLITTMTAQTMGFVICSIMLVDQALGELVLKATTSTSPAYIGKPGPRVGESIAGQVVMTGHPITVLDVRQSPQYKYPDVAQQEGLCSMACVPLVFKQRVIGVLNCYTAEPHQFTEDEIRMLTTIGNQAAVAIENSKLMVKSAIVQEMHHRIKNNLQTVASLLRLQMHHRAGSPEELLSESINRVLSIASVHDLLSRGDLDAVSFRQIADSILSAAKQNLIRPGKQVHTRIEGADMMLDASRATSMALVLNELVQNAIEHGFPDATEGTIAVVLSQDEVGVTVDVRNDGVPLPNGFRVGSTGSLGLHIVDSLVRETLHGRFTMFQDGPEAVARVVFPPAGG
jgi:two-component sensor histidine kinase/putative methionine-R-sulfoxide reductase with GAF domain